MKFMLNCYYKTKKTSEVYTFSFPKIFRAKRLSVDFDETTGILTLSQCGEDDGIKGYDGEYKKSFTFGKIKWLPTMPRKGFKAEAEWKNGELSVKVCEPVRRIKPEDKAPEKTTVKIKEKAQTAALCKQPDNSGYTDEEIARKAIKFLNKFVSENDDHRFEIADGELKVSRTIVEYL